MSADGADGWQAAQNWLLFGAIAGGLAVYYYPREKKPTAAPVAPRAPVPPPKARPSSSKERTPKPKKAKADPAPVPKTTASAKASTLPQQSKSTGQSPQHQETKPTASDEAEDGDDGDLKQWVKSMNAARQGTELKSAESTKNNVRTVKQRSAQTVEPAVAQPQNPSHDEDADDWSHVGSTAAKANGITDMLEPVAPGPASLRITAPQRPVKEKVARPAKKEEVETKKQRQNRLKKEAQRTEREAAEKERKALEEQQRRTARESRGEPARNGTPLAPAKTPANAVWSSSSAAAPAVQAPARDGGALLDTFDADSTSSSYVGGSTAATSTTDAAAPSAAWTDADYPSGDAAFDQAREESELQSGWNEVKTKTKKGKKKMSNGELDGENTAPAAPSTKPTRPPPSTGVVFVNGTKPNGFQALDDAFDRNGHSEDVDPSDASAWEA